MLASVLRWIRQAPVRAAVSKLMRQYEDDDWLHLPVEFGLAELGCPVRTPINWYTTGPSSVEVSTPSDISEWLRACTYERSATWIDDSGFWLHPSVLETKRLGDCVPFALWAWNRLTSIGEHAALTMGQVSRDGHLSQHAWVTLIGDVELAVFEPTSKDPTSSVYALSDVKRAYVPWYAESNRGYAWLFGGYCGAIKRKYGWDF